MLVSATNNTTNVYSVIKNSNETVDINKNNFESLLEKKTPKDISYDEYKKLSKDDLKKLFLNKDDFSKANILRMTAISSSDETLGKILFNKQISEVNSVAGKYVKSDIDSSLFSIISIKLSIIELKRIGDRVSAIIKNNPNITIHEAFNYLSLEDMDYDLKNSNSHQEKYDYAIENTKITAEEYFEYIERHITFTRKLIEDEKKGIRIGSPTEYEKYIDDIEFIHNKIKAEYEKKIEEIKSLKEYHKLNNIGINHINLYKKI
ncbi:MAG: hypothetical protein MJK08_02725 [Campylobacterales bacterium]|nr:hypothetical protein [Campylobacterales bacterium]